MSSEGVPEEAFGRQSRMNVKKTQTRQYQYVKIENEGNRYFCMQQNPGLVAWMLFFERDIFRPLVRAYPSPCSLKSILGWFRKQYGLLRKNFGASILFAACHYQWRDTSSVLELPCYGQLCVPVHQGNKIFDFHREVVIKVFHPDVPTSVIFNEIERLKEISRIDFAPSIRNWNIEERWYEEDYLTGSLDSSYKPMDSKTLLSKFHDVIVRQLNALILFQEPKVSKALSYATDVTKILKSSRLSEQKSTVGEFIKITQFIDSMIARLKAEDDCAMLLVFAHGDFVPANMLNTHNGMKIIDWEGAGYRSAMFDFYSYFFYRPANRNIPVSTLIWEVQKALPLFVAELTKTSQVVSQSIMRMESIYRWIFYVEMLCRLIEREMSDENLNMMNAIVRYFEAFDQYEEMVGGHSPLSSIH